MKRIVQHLWYCSFFSGRIRCLWCKLTSVGHRTPKMPRSFLMLLGFPSKKWPKTETIVGDSLNIDALLPRHHLFAPFMQKGSTSRFKAPLAVIGESAESAILTPMAFMRQDIEPWGVFTCIRHLVSAFTEGIGRIAKVSNHSWFSYSFGRFHICLMCLSGWRCG